MKAPTLTPAQFDAVHGELTSMIEDWVDRECTSFDAAVQRAAGEAENAPSIWDVPQIDSKRTVSLLTALEPLLGGKNLPATLIKKGGYGSLEELKAGLVPRLRQHCTGVTATAPDPEQQTAATSWLTAGATPAPLGVQ